MLGKIGLVLGNPAAAVVSERLGHEGQLGLVIAGLGDTGGVNLGVAGVGKISPLLVRFPVGGDRAPHGIGGEVENVDVATGAEADRVGGIGFQLAADQVAAGDPLGHAVNDNQVQHFATIVHLHGAGRDLAGKSRIGPQKELLSRLPPGEEGPGDLGAAEGAVVQIAGVVTGKGNSLGHALVDDVVGDLGQTPDVGFSGPEVPPLDGVVEEAVDGVAVIGIGLGGVDPPLGGDGVGAARRILVAEGLDIISQFSQ